MSRDELAARQAELLRAKRRSIVADLRPDLPQALGERFGPLFDAYAVATPRADGIGYRQDAENFAAWLARRGNLPRPRRWFRRR